MKGIAGGMKYYVNGIYLKFAVNSFGLFESDEQAIKVAGHELKGQMAYSSVLENVWVPLMALLDYRGFRLVAMSSLLRAFQKSHIFTVIRRGSSQVKSCST